MDQWTLGTGMQQSYPGTIVEAMGLFSDLLANPVFWQKFKPERQRQGLCPDFLIPGSNCQYGTRTLHFLELTVPVIQ